MRVQVNQRPHLNQHAFNYKIHILKFKPQESPYIALFNDLNSGNWFVKQQQFLGFLGQSQDVEIGNDAIAIDMQGQEAKDVTLHPFSPFMKGFHIYPWVIKIQNVQPTNN
jgi:hypothetical protein